MKSRICNIVAGMGIGFIIGVFLEHNRMDRIIMQKIKRVDRIQNYMNLLLIWLNLHEEKASFDSYFKWRGVSYIAVYGNGKIGQQFIKEMKGMETKVTYIIDRGADSMASDLPIMTVDAQLPQVDAIVVTIIDQFDDIADILREKCEYPVISLEEVIYGSGEIQIKS